MGGTLDMIGTSIKAGSVDLSILTRISRWSRKTPAFPFGSLGGIYTNLGVPVGCASLVGPGDHVSRKSFVEEKSDSLAEAGQIFCLKRRERLIV